MQESLLSWNLNSFQKKYPYLQILLHKYKLLAVALRETKLNPNKNCYIKNYEIFRCELQTINNLKGGVLIAALKNNLIKHTISSSSSTNIY